MKSASKKQLRRTLLCALFAGSIAAPFAAPQALPLRLLGRTRPGEREVAANPRARSAILRVAERTAAPWSGEAA